MSLTAYQFYYVIVLHNRIQQLEAQAARRQRLRTDRMRKRVR